MYQLIIYAAENTVDYLEDEQVGCLCNNSKAWPGNYVILTFKVQTQLFFSQAVNKQYSLLSSLPPHFLPSCPHKEPVSLNITFPFIFHFLSMYFISTFFCFTVLHTDSTSASSLASSTVQTRHCSVLWEICKSTQTFLFFFFFMIVRHGFILENIYFWGLGLTKVCKWKKSRSLDLTKYVALYYDSGVHMPDILIIILSSFFLTLCTLYICINVTACNHFLCHRRLI